MEKIKIVSREKKRSKVALNERTKSHTTSGKKGGDMVSEGRDVCGWILWACCWVCGGRCGVGGSR